MSPYISRGVLSTRKVYAHLLILDLPWNQIEKLVQELAWRDYWQLVWISKGEQIKADLNNTQNPVSNHGIPKVVVEAKTGIEAVDQAIRTLYHTGYMHNHMRMYVASVCCNVAQSHWLTPANWLYYHLLDGDLASNHLSWQWVAGTNANKKYFANQQNINTNFHSKQRGTFLDVDYEAIEKMDIPEILHETFSPKLETQLPVVDRPVLNPHQETFIYNYYNLDPTWHAEEKTQRVLLLEPSFFRKYPVSSKSIDFIVKLSENIRGIQLFVGEFAELQEQLPAEHIIFKEHPTNQHYRGKEESRDWLSHVRGFYPSFFAFWKQCRKELLSAKL